MGLFTKSSSPRPRRQHSEPTYETPPYNQEPQTRQYAQQQQQKKFGPHFQKGPLQEEIFDRRADGEKIPAGHPDLRDRAHSFHQPRQHHEYSDPFKKIPQKWSRQMSAEWANYHALTDGKDEKSVDAIALADNLPVGRKHHALPEHGTIIRAGMAASDACAAHSNRAGQARGGFAHKYPQSYEDLDATASHDKEVAKCRNNAAKYRGKTAHLANKHALWASKMEKQ